MRPEMTCLFPCDYDFVVIGDQRPNNSVIYRSSEMSAKDVADALRRLAEAYDPR
jgi:hypothetical protein